jgi:DNA-binding CsgD family transcriptional regulator
MDVNSWFLKSFNAETKRSLLDSNFSGFVIDHEKYRLFAEHLLAGNIIQNEKFYVKDINGKPDTKFAYASVLSFEKQQIFIQLFEVFLYNHPTIDRSESILKEITKLSPHLNNTGKERLSEIINTYENILKDNELISHLALIKHKIGFIYPALSIIEVDISALLVLGFSTVEISVYGGYSASNVRNAVFRICKKLEVNSLEELLNVFQLLNLPAKYYPETSNLPR